MERAAGDHDDALAVGLHQVGLIDPELLEVGADDALASYPGYVGGLCCRKSRGDLTIEKHGARVIPATVEPVWPDEVDGVLDRPVEQIVTRGERHQRMGGVWGVGPEDRCRRDP